MVVFLFKYSPMSTVLVIGASRGIGLELVRQYAEAGARVIATARDEEGLARVRALGAEGLKWMSPSRPASAAWPGSSMASQFRHRAVRGRCHEPRQRH
jgi:NAD(P)-dependent dehydrogenase (short-subunit alcohol dehydrogenase family)